MTILLAVMLGAFAYSADRRWRLLRIGSAEHRWDRIGERLKATRRFALAQERMRRYPLAGIAHYVIFLGFLVLLLRSLILFSRGYVADSGLFLFRSHTLIGDMYSLLKDFFVFLVILGTLVFFYFRLVAKLPRMTLNIEALVILGIILMMMVGDIVYDGAWINLQARADGSVVVHRGWEPLGSLMAVALSDTSERTLKILAHMGFWVHTSLVLIFLNLLPHSKHFHIITAIPNGKSKSSRISSAVCAAWSQCAAGRTSL